MSITVDVFETVLPEVQATLRVSGRLDPGVLEEILSAKVRASSGDAGTAVCKLNTPKEQTIDAASHVESLLSMIRPQLNELRKLVVMQSLDVDVEVVTSSPREDLSIYLDAIRVAELASIGAGLRITTQV